MTYPVPNIWWIRNIWSTWEWFCTSKWIWIWRCWDCSFLCIANKKKIDRLKKKKNPTDVRKEIIQDLPKSVPLKDNFPISGEGDGRCAFWKGDKEQRVCCKVEEEGEWEGEGSLLHDTSNKLGFRICEHILDQIRHALDNCLKDIVYLDKGCLSLIVEWSTGRGNNMNEYYKYVTVFSQLFCTHDIKPWSWHYQSETAVIPSVRLILDTSVWHVFQIQEWFHLLKREYKKCQQWLFEKHWMVV